MDILDEIRAQARLTPVRGTKVLYHGSKGGIRGPVNPHGRQNCDFGSGFYMGTNKWQAKSLVYGKRDSIPWSYDLSIDMTDLAVIDVSGIAWALFVTSNRHPENFSGIRGFSE